MDNKYKVINMETGEVINNKYDVGRTEKITKYKVDNMLTIAKSVADLDTNMLYRWCRITKAINIYGQIQMLGSKLNNDIEGILIEEGIVCSYVLKAIKLSHPFSYILMKNHKSFINSWKELWEAIGCLGNKRIQKKIKKFLVDNGLINKFKLSLGNEKVVSRIILNPYLYKGSSHSGQIACIVWQGYAKPSINVNQYAYKWLQGMGYIK